MISDIIPDDEPFKASVLFFSDYLLRSFLNKFSSEIVEDIASSDPQLYKMQSELLSFVDFTESMYSNEDSLIVHQKLEEFLYLMSRGANGDRFLGTIASLVSSRRESIKTFMEANFEKPLKIEDYATLTGRSVASFHRDFKRHFGEAPKTWIMKKRLEMARHKILTSDMTVANVAALTGYDNVSHFIRVFTREYGTSPKQYRLSMAKDVQI